jgi:uncharacterized protein YndB with AHSA1/START domain
MERKTKVHAEEGKQELLITREFDLPVELLFRAHVDPEIFEQWMSHEYGNTKVLKYEMRKHGGWQFQTVDAQGGVLFRANGAIHDVVPNELIIRTFEMDDSSFPVQLDFLEFSALSPETSKLSMHTIYRTLAHRDEMLKLPFAQGMDMAHNRLQNLLRKVK